MTVYEYLTITASTELVDRFHINLFQRYLFLDALPIIQKGLITFTSVLLPDGRPDILDSLIQFDENPYTEIERLYTQFKRSVPNKHERLNKGCFKAVSSDLLTMKEMENNLPRQEARLLLEGFVLLASAAGLIPWHNPTHFFWQGADPDLILYRDWII